MSEQTESKTVKAGGTTYFFDLKQAKDGKSYLVITASRLKGRERGAGTGNHHCLSRSERSLATSRWGVYGGG